MSKRGFVAGMLSWIVVGGMIAAWHDRMPRALLVVAVVVLVASIVGQFWLVRYEARRSRITRRHLEEAPMWALFQGPAEDPGPIKWALFEVDQAVVLSDDAWERVEALHLGVRRTGTALRPELLMEETQDVDDLDAALAYLRQGGALCKVPDKYSTCWWLLAIEPKEEEMT